MADVTKEEAKKESKKTLEKSTEKKKKSKGTKKVQKKNNRSSKKRKCEEIEVLDLNDSQFDGKDITTNQTKSRWRRIIIGIIVFIVLGVVIVRGIHYYQNYKQEQNIYYKNVSEKFLEFYADYKKEIPKEDITIKEVEAIEPQIKKISYTDKKDEMLEKTKRLKNYLNVKERIDNCFSEDILKSSITGSEIEKINKELDKLSNTYQSLLKEKLEKMNTQYQNIENLRNEVTNLFTDDTRTVVKNEVTRDHYNRVVEMLKTVVQEDIVSSERRVLDKVLDELLSRESESIKRRGEEISSSWIRLNVSYISQNMNRVLNGSEVVSLLMGLKYKGYLSDMDVWAYANLVPKSSDPFSGFTNSIFSLEPKDVPHWIAPNALASFGRSSSGNSNIYDTTGESLDALDHEVEMGNPVVIYLTTNVKAPSKWVEGAPKNIHSYLLVGYNSKTGEQMLIDPWTANNGETRLTLSNAKVQNIYNATGKRSVVIK